jgi:signal transduction histidine kinase
MFSKVFPTNLPSQWRLGILQSVLLLGSVLLCMIVVSLALQRDLGSIATAVVLDDLGEYSTLYNREGLDAIEKVYAAGKHEDHQGIRVTRIDGKIVFERMPALLQEFPWPHDPPPAIHSESSVLSTYEHPANGMQLLIGCRLLADGNVLWFGRTNAEDTAYVDRIQQYLWLAGLVATALAMLPMAWFMQHVLDPVKEMITSAQHLAQGSTDARLAAPMAVPELREFAEAFNQGLDQIAALTSELQLANDNLAHELRTPLARIRGNLELYHDHTDNPTAKEASARGLDEIDRATQLVQTILTTRAGEHRALKLHLEVHDIAALLRSLYDLYLPAAEERSLRLTIEAEATRFVLLDRERLTQALANLLDNAFSYTPKFGNVTLVLELHPGLVRILVRDTGPGIRPDELQRIWLRHMRGSAASARTPGMGLGLSLVRAIAHSHNGWADCRNREEGGAEFWIDLPAGDPLSAASLV